MQAPDQLQNAYRLVQQGQFAAAQQILLPMVRQSPANADAWWLLATTYPSDPARAQYALEQLLQLRPDDSRARDMLDRLRASGVPSRSPFDTSASVGGFSSGDSGSYSRGFGDFANTSGTYNTQATDPFGQSYTEKPKNDFQSSSPSYPPSYVPMPPRRGTHPCVSCLALIGALTLIVCALCTVMSISLANSMGPEFENAMGTLAADPDLQRFVEAVSTAIGTPGAFNFSTTSGSMPDSIPGDASVMGVLEYGSSEEQQIGSDEYHLYTFRANAGDRIEITMEAVGLTTGFDSEVALYDPQKNLIDQNDDVGGGSLNSYLAARLSSDGTYSILVRDHRGNRGRYRLTLDRATEPTRTATPAS